ncbi:uncharacterized protein BDV14DRAFT_197008 [Aspergillus stella-maris]|uniref:uncharacterized protein n=1 Tax=Aspergillus stella-maris TaxID=1810926 RepID=UPI003CCE0F18
MAPFVAPSQPRSIPQTHAYQHQQHQQYRFYQPLAEGAFQLHAPSPLSLTNPMPYPNQGQSQPEPHSQSEITYPHLLQNSDGNTDTTESNAEVAYPSLPHPPARHPSPIPNPDLPHPNPYWPTHDPTTISQTLTPADKTYGIAVNREDNIYFTTGRLCKLLAFPYFIRVDLPLRSRAGMQGVQTVSFAEFESKAAEMVRVQVSGDALPPLPRIGETSWGYSWDLEDGEVRRGVGCVTGVGMICLAVVLDDDDEEEEDSEEEGEIREDYFPDQRGEIWGRDTYFGFKPSLGFR